MDTYQEFRFPSAEEVPGFFIFDKMHAPRPIHPLSSDLVVDNWRSGSPKPRRNTRMN